MFKNIIANDIEDVFLNLSEFADVANINGKDIKIVIDSEARTYEPNIEEMERTVGNILFYVSKETWKSTYGVLPKAYDAIKFNNISCVVVRSHERNGMLGITLDYGG
jgi:hypothetical protein